MHMFRKIGQAAAFAAMLLALGWTGSALAQEPIRIGSFLAVTGPAAFLGDPEKRTLELYVDRINADGGLLGRQVELTVYDTGLSAQEAVTFARRLIEQDEVHVIIGGTTTGETMAVIPVVERAGIPFVSLAGGSVIVEPTRRWVFKTPHTDRMAVEKVYQDMQRNNIQRIGLIAGSGGFDQSCTANARDLASQYGIEIVADENYGSGDTDVTPQLTNIRNADGLQAVLFCGFGAPSVIVTRNYAQLDIQVPLYHNHGSCSARFVSGSGEAAQGVRLPCAALVVSDQLAQDDVQYQVTRDYRATYEEATGDDVSTFGGHAYDALFLVVDAIRRAGSTEPEAIRAALESTQNFVGVDGIFNMSPEDHMGLDQRSFRMIEVRNGGWNLLY